MNLVAKNLTHYRKVNNLTQLQLAEKLNYSDKSVSKWERGESLPDIYVLYKITELYGITLNDLTSKKKPKRKLQYTKSKLLSTLILIGICWLLATVVYVLFGIFIPSFKLAWLSFIYAIPLSMIVLIILSIRWWNMFITYLSTSLLIWSIPLAIFLSIRYDNLWLLFICAIPIQIIITFWFTLQIEINRNISK